MRMRNVIISTIHLMYSELLSIKKLRWAGHVARMEEVRRAFKISTGKPTGKRPLGKSRQR